MNWTGIWMNLFGTTSVWGIDMGFWVAMAVVTLIVLLMNGIFWGMKPKKTGRDKTSKSHSDAG